MAVEWFKLQTPVFTSTPDVTQVLLQNRDRSVYSEVQGTFAQQLIDGLKMKPRGDKLYVRAIIDEAGQFIADRDTVTRKDKGW